MFQKMIETIWGAESSSATAPQRESTYSAAHSKDLHFSGEVENLKSVGQQGSSLCSSSTPPSSVQTVLLVSPSLGGSPVSSTSREGKGKSLVGDHNHGAEKALDAACRRLREAQLDAFHAILYPTAGDITIRRFDKGSKTHTRREDTAPETRTMAYDMVKETDGMTAISQEASLVVDLIKLRQASWHGCPLSLRHDAWMLLTGHWHPDPACRAELLQRKGDQYVSYMRSVYGTVDWDEVCAVGTVAGGGAGAGALGASATPLLTRGGGGGSPSNPLRRRGLSQQRQWESGLHGLPSASLSNVAIPGFQGPLATSLDLSTLQGPPDCLNLPSFSSDCTLLNSAPRASRELCSLPTPQHMAGGNYGVASLTGSFATETSPCTSLHDELLYLADSGGGTGGGGGGSGDRSQPKRPRLLLPQSHITMSVEAMIGSEEMRILKQIRKDIPRMAGASPTLKREGKEESFSRSLHFLMHPRVQGTLERVLFVWALRHPACGYVQGMNDLVAPFLCVTLANHFCLKTRSLEELQMLSPRELDSLWSESRVPVNQWLQEVEVELYWSSSYFLEGWQDNFTHSQSGITVMTHKVEAVMKQADPKLYSHLTYTLQISMHALLFRWMNCLLTRELAPSQTLRLFDAYLSSADKESWATMHVNVCAALLLRWSRRLLSMQESGAVMLFFQNPPTEELGISGVDELLAEAFVLEQLYDVTTAH